MNNVVPFPSAVEEDEYFAGCPHCRKVGNIFNVGRNHWAVCHRHKTKWLVGSNLFSNWREETEADWLSNQYRLANYRIVEPYADAWPGGAA
jgi:hypothetical protein